MVVPINPRTKVIMNHDGFTGREGGVAGATPEALAGLFPMGYRPPEDVQRATLSFYLGRIEPYVGFPMLSAPLGVWAARLGDRKRSAELFEAGYAEFINDPYRETNEFSNVRFPDKPPVGPLFANVGGFLTSLMLKDLKLAQEAAAKSGAATPLGAQAEATYALFERLGFGAKDFSAVMELMRGRLEALSGS